MNIDCDKIDWENIFMAPNFADCFKNFQEIGKVVNVYDGDSVKIIMPFDNKLYRFTCRLEGIDTPEIRSSSELEKTFAKKVRDQLREKAMNKLVSVKCSGLDKYGRLLAIIQLDNEEKTVNDWLIEEGYAFKYDGGTKQSWAEYLLNKQVLKEYII